MRRYLPNFLPRARLLHRVVLWSLLCALTAMCFAAPAMAADSNHAVDLGWWKKARFGMFIHWGLYSEAAGFWHGKPVPGYGEWIMNSGRIPRKQYATLAAKFDPVKFNADKWVSIAKAAGVKYIVITSKHHEGFCMFNTKATKYNIVDDTPWHTDPLALLAAACKKQGIRFCVYYSIMDWHSRFQAPARGGPQPIYNPTHFVPGGEAPYLHYMETELREIVTQYHPGLIWFDGQWMNGWTRADGVVIRQELRELDPNLIVNNRIDPQGAVDHGQGFGGDYATPEQQIPPGGIPGNWETCMTINNTWGYKRQDKQFKSAAMLITNLIKCASGGGNYLLNVGPTGLGVIPKPEVMRLMAMGRWLKANGAAIYGSHRMPFKKAMPWGYITSKPGKLYLEVVHWQKTITVPMSNTVTKAYLLAGGQSVTISSSAKGVVVSLPTTAPDKIASVVVLEFSGAVKPL
ncbi:MAG: alpha-L-fucosidase [Phycisphaerae bacterium]